MVAPAFGFGAGDFVEAIKLIAKICKALRDTGGLAHDYQQAALELSNISSVLQKVQSLKATSNNVEIVEKIRLCTHTGHIPLVRFVQKVEKFDARLGPPAGRSKVSKLSRWIPDSGRKVQWAIATAGEVTKQKNDLAVPLQLIEVLLQLEGLQQLSHTQETSAQVLATAQDLFTSVNDLKSFITMSLVPMIDSLSAQIDRQVGTALRDGEQQTNALLQNVESAVLAQHDVLKQILDILESRSRPTIETTSQSVVSSPVSRPRQADGDDSATNDATYQLFLLFELIRRGVGDVILLLIGLLPIFLRYWRGMTQIARAPTLLVGNNIQLEDALGRTMSLPFEHFRHWPVLEARLKQALAGLPGEQLVAANHFDILNMKSGGDLVLTKQNWTRAIAPGAKVAMSMRFPNTLFHERACPRCRYSEFDVPVNAWAQCTSCHLTYRVLPERLRNTSEATDADPSTQLENGYDTGITRLWRLVKDLKPLPKASDLQHFQRIHVLRRSAEEIGLAADHVDSLQQMFDRSRGINAGTCNQLLEQYNELQQQTTRETEAMRNALAFWNPLDITSLKDAYS